MHTHTHTYIHTYTHTLTLVFSRKESKWTETISFRETNPETKIKQGNKPVLVTNKQIASNSHPRF